MFDMLRFVVVIYEFKKIVKFFFEEFGVDFIQYLYVFEIDLVIGILYYECGDYNYVLKRVVVCIWNGNYLDLNFEVFVEVMCLFNIGFIYIVFVGKRK